MPVLRTSLGIAYNVLISGMSYTMDIAYKNTLGSRKYVRITYIRVSQKNRIFEKFIGDHLRSFYVS